MGRKDIRSTGTATLKRTLRKTMQAWPSRIADSSRVQTGQSIAGAAISVRGRMFHVKHTKEHGEIHSGASSWLSVAVLIHRPAFHEDVCDFEKQRKVIL